MLIDERKDTALKSLRDAENALGYGDSLRASEKIWGAAEHAIVAVAQQRGLPVGDFHTTMDTARSIAEELDDSGLRAGIAAAHLFHSNIDIDHMEDEDLWPTAILVHRFVYKMLALVE